MSIDESALWRIVHRMDEAAERASRAAEQMDEAARRIAQMLEPGYGGNGLRLIELLEQVSAEQLASASEGGL